MSDTESGPGRGSWICIVKFPLSPRLPSTLPSSPPLSLSLSLARSLASYVRNFAQLRRRCQLFGTGKASYKSSFASSHPRLLSSSAI